MAELEGFLYKQGVGALGKAFKKRWFKKQGQALYYYKQKGDVQELGRIDLSEAIQECKAVQGAVGKFLFQIPTAKRVWQLAAETEDQMNKWIEAINSRRAGAGSDDPRKSVRYETMENRIQDLERNLNVTRVALELAASKLGVSVNSLLEEVENQHSGGSSVSVSVAAVSASSASASAAAPAAVSSSAAAPSSENRASGESAAVSSEPPFAKEDEKSEKKADIQRFKAKVLYDYSAQQDYELSIRVNEVIVVMSKHGNGWWLGQTSDGKQGYFPGSYVEPIEE